MYQYWYHYGAEQEVKKWLYIASGISLAVLLAPGLFFFAPAKRSLFGDARFAKRSEIKKAGLFGEKGIIVGQIGGRYLMFEGQQHAIISAPTRSGKGVGIVIPNLLNWPESVVVLDIKQENWDITSAFRRKYGQECFLFNPAATDYRTHRYNPLSYISEDPNFRIDDVQKIGNMLFPDQPGTDVIWTATPRSLFLGIVLYLLETPGKAVTLGQVLRETLVDGDGSAYFAKIINDRAASGNPLSGACVRGLNTYISIASENTRSGIIGGFRSRLELWMNPLVDAATSANDFDLRDVRKKRMSIYLGVTPDNLERMAPLLNLFFQQLIDLNTRVRPEQSKAIKYTCMLVMDEFTAIGQDSHSVERNQLHRRLLAADDADHSKPGAVDGSLRQGCCADLPDKPRFANHLPAESLGNTDGAGHF
jgi:type IV secretion system protein VirD4